MEDQPMASYPCMSNIEIHVVSMSLYNIDLTSPLRLYKGFPWVVPVPSDPRPSGCRNRVQCQSHFQMPTGIRNLEKLSGVATQMLGCSSPPPPKKGPSHFVGVKVSPAATQNTTSATQNATNTKRNKHTTSIWLTRP